MAKVYEFLTNGYEEVEALVPVDVLRRAGAEVVLVSTTGDFEVVSAHGVKIVADCLIEYTDTYDAHLMMIPGGMPGSELLCNNDAVRAAIWHQYDAGKLVSAICAGPMIFGSLGISVGRRMTCYPGFEHLLRGATYTGDLVTVDGNVVTGKGPGASFAYAFTLCEILFGKTTADALREGMIYPF